jgi:hypothetical protein
MPVPSAPRVTELPLASNQTLEFLWDPPADTGGPSINKYRLILTPYGGSAIVRYPSGDAIFWQETGLTNNTWYTISLEASNDDGLSYGAPALFRSYQPGSPPTRPPATATATRVGESSALVSWTAPTVLPDAEIRWYSIYARSSNPSDPVIEKGANGLTQTSVMINGLNPLSTYYFEIYAVNCPGYSPVAVTNTINWNINVFTANWGATLFTSSGGTGNIVSVTPTSIKRDASDNYYVAGRFNSSGTFTVQNVNGSSYTPSSIILSNRLNNIFLIKYNSSGLAQWAVTLESTEQVASTSHLDSIEVDSSGNIYITGQYTNLSTTFLRLQDASGNTQVNSAVSLRTSVGGSGDVYVIKYNTNGIVQWATCMNATNNSRGYGLLSDASNNIYVAGYYNGTAILYDTSGNIQKTSSATLPVTSASTPFLIKYNSSGIAQWATYFPISQTSQISKLSKDSSGNIYAVGFYNSSSEVTLKDASGNTTQKDSLVKLPISSNNDLFLIKYSPQGQVLWATNMSGTSTDQGLAIVTDSSDNLYIAGSYISTSIVTLQNVSGNGQSPSTIKLPITLSTTSDTFLIKYNASGIAQWATYIAGGSGGDVGYGVGIDSTNAVYITGQYFDVSGITLQNASGDGQSASSITLLPTGNAGNMFLVKYTTSGSVSWATCIASSATSSSAIGNAITFDSSDNVYVCGTYSPRSVSSIVYDANGNSQQPTSITLPAYDAYNSLSSGFTVKYNSNGTALTGYPPLNVLQGIINLGASPSYSNPSLTTDLLGNIYMVGGFSIGLLPIPLQNKNGSLSNITLMPPTTSSLLGRSYLLKYDTDGNILWATTFFTNDIAVPFGVTTDASNNIYVTGRYKHTLVTSIILRDASGNGQVDSTVTLPPCATNAQNNGFLIKYNSNGNVQWAIHIPVNGSSQSITGYAVKTDSSNNIYITGQYYRETSSLTLQDASGGTQKASALGVTLPISVSNADAFLMKYSSSGIVQWATCVPGPSNDIAYGLVLDSAGGIYIISSATISSAFTLLDVSGNIQAPSSFSYPLVSGNTTAVLLIKYNSLGKVQWATRTFSTVSISNPYGVVIDSFNNLYITGVFGVTTTLQSANGTGQSSTSITAPAGAFLMKYNSNGIAQWATSFKGTGGATGYGLALDRFNNIYMTGVYDSTSIVTLKDVSGNIQKDSSFTLPLSSTSLSVSLYFIVKYNSDGIVIFGNTAIRGANANNGYSMVGYSCIVYSKILYIYGSVFVIYDNFTLQNTNESGTNSTSSVILYPSTNAPFLLKYDI